MKTRDRWIVIGSMCVALALAVQVWRLERKVDALSDQLRSQPRAIALPAAQPNTTREPHKPPIFRLIDSDAPPEGHTKIGVPWSVERAMLIEGAKGQREFELRNDMRIEVEAREMPPAELNNLPAPSSIEWNTDSPL